MTLLEPRNYWQKVPAKWKPYWHFFNTPISADPLHPDSPIRLIKSIATQSEYIGQTHLTICRFLSLLQWIVSRTSCTPAVSYESSA